MKIADVLKILEANGASAETLAKCRKSLSKRAARADEMENCPACGARTLKNDYVCGSCSSVKAASERRFWSYTMDREQGGEGRPKQKKADPTRASGVRVVNHDGHHFFPVLRWWVAEYTWEEPLEYTRATVTRRAMCAVRAETYTEARDLVRQKKGQYPLTTTDAGFTAPPKVELIWKESR